MFWVSPWYAEAIDVRDIIDLYVPFPVSSLIVLPPSDYWYEIEELHSNHTEKI